MIFRDKNGQVIIYGLMLAVVIFIVAMALINPLNEGVTNTMNDMNCSGTNLSIGTQAACVSTDFSLPIFILTIIGIGGVAMLGRIIFA